MEIMSMSALKKVLEKNTSKHLGFDGAYFESQRLPWKKKQEDLLCRHILPNHELFLCVILEIRRDIDQMMIKTPEVIAIGKQRKYPVGFCQEITNHMFECLLVHIRTDRRLGFLRSFIQEGGVIHCAWGIRDNRMFHNVIQIGSGILDVSLDTGDVREHRELPVDFYEDLRYCPFREIHDFDDLAGITEKYWWYDVYPNTVFPNLAPAYPYLVVDKIVGDKILGDVTYCTLERHPFHLWRKNLSSVRNDCEGLCQKAYHFIHDGEFSHKEIPEEIMEKLFSQGSFARKLAKYQPRMWRMSIDPQCTEDRFLSFWNPMERENGSEETESLIVRYMEMVQQVSRLKNRPLSVI